MVEATNLAPRQPIESYPWEGGVSTVFFVCSFQDYDRLCPILVNRLNTSLSGYTLTLNAHRRGLGDVRHFVCASVGKTATEWG